MPYYNPHSGYNSYQNLGPRASYPNSTPRAAFLATSEGDMADQGWYIDSGATHHLTNSLQNLNLGREYSGNQLLHVGNGQGLNIIHIGYTCLPTSCDSFMHLQDILCVHHLTKNLISISKLLEDTNLIIEFVVNMCFIKDKKKRVHLAQGIARGGLYKLVSKDDFLSSSCVTNHNPSSMLSVFNQAACKFFGLSLNKDCTQTSNHQSHLNTVNTVMFANVLHQRFSHSNKHALKSILSSLALHYPTFVPNFYDACQYGKMHQLFFYSTCIKTKVPLELVHTNSSISKP